MNPENHLIGLQMLQAFLPQIRLSQISFLLLVYMRPGRNMSETASDLDVTLSALSRQVRVFGNRYDSAARAKTLGWVDVCRSTSNDREVILRMTDKGNKIIGKYLDICG